MKRFAGKSAIEELHFLLELLSAEEMESFETIVLEKVNDGNISWTDLLELAADNKVLLWLASKIIMVSEGLIPDGIIKKCRYSAHRARLQQLKYIREFFSIKEILERNQVPFIPFKGFHFAHTYFNDITIRESSDLDLLIKPKDLPLVISEMQKFGYVPSNGIQIHNIDYVNLIKNLPEFNMDLMENGKRISHVEFHWKISGPPLTIPCYLEEMEEFVSEGNLQGKSYPRFDPGGDLLLTSFHHGGKEDWSKLGYILDIAMLLKSNPDFDFRPAICWAEKRNLSKVVLTGIQLAMQLFNVNIPDTLSEKANRSEIRAIAINRIENIHFLASGIKRRPLRFRPIFYHLKSRDTIWEKVKLTRDYLLYFVNRMSSRFK